MDVVAKLFEELGSGVAEVMAGGTPCGSVLERTVPAGAVAGAVSTIEMVLLPPAAIEATLQLRVITPSTVGVVQLHPGAL